MNLVPFKESIDFKEKMYQSKRFIERKTASVLKKRLDVFLENHNYVTCIALGRKVFLDELPDAIIKRSDAKSRLMCFWVGLDIIKRSEKYTEKKIGRKRHYEISALSADGKLVFVHLREKIENKDRRLLLISTFYKH